MENQTDKNITHTPPVSPVETPPVSKPKSKLPFLIIGIILFFLVAGGAAGFYVFKPLIMTTVFKIPSTQIFPTPKINRVERYWKEYKNDSAGYTLQHPTGWTVLEAKETNASNSAVDDPNLYTLLKEKNEIHKTSFIEGQNKPGKIQVIVKGNPQNLNVDQLLTNELKTGSKNNVKHTGTFTENYIPGIELSSAEDGFLVQSKILIANQKIYYVRFYYPPSENDPSSMNYGDKYAQAFALFKITQSNDVDTSNWKTYQKTEFGLSIKYPQDLPIYEEVTPTQAGEKGFTSVHFVNPPESPGIGPVEGVWIKMYDNAVQPNYLITQKNDYESLIKLAVGEKKQIIGTMFTRLANDTNLTKAYVFEERAVPNYPAETISYAKGYLFKNVNNLIYISVVPLSENSTDKYMNYFEKMLQTLKFTQ